MAHRLMPAGSRLRGLFKLNRKPNFDKTGTVRRSSVFVEPSVPWLEKPSIVFSSSALKRHWGALPVIIICAIGLGLEILATMRLAVTRDDVYYTKNSAACDFVETRVGYKVPQRKFLVINQKYENPPGLLNALQGDVKGPSDDAGDEKKKNKK
ncbi:uncharacterized protein LOC6563132 isoform X2 [Drosophila grimshawi]|uniref:uncharacterized protein LOC6563132 isoform X2 n=1 Tax=Drosophila grimshawi TaxID=7222 RepID=UPI000C870589|nr:uncharacterized protein LOC6563132 isoform X2 [Drosophila grimshawi]